MRPPPTPVPYASSPPPCIINPSNEIYDLCADTRRAQHHFHFTHFHYFDLYFFGAKMSSTVDHPLVLQWLSRIPGSNSESLPTSDRSNHGPYGQIYSKSLPTYSQIIPSHKFHTTRARSVHNSDSDTTLSSTKFNSMHRSTYELLKSLPSPLHTLRILPYLPTYQANLDTLITMIPNRADNPIVSHMFLFCLLILFAQMHR